MHSQKRRQSSISSIAIPINTTKHNNNPKSRSNVQLNVPQTRQISTIKQQKLKKVSEKYDAKFCISVIGCIDSGKEEILSKECECQVKQINGISIITKDYFLGDKVVQVEFWCAPEDTALLSYTCRLVSNLAGTILFCDVTSRNGLTELDPWIDQICTKNECSLGHVKVLVGTKIDMPGKRVLLQEDLENFAYSHGMEYYETSVTDEIDAINEIFYFVVSQLVKKIPFIDRTLSKQEDYTCPIGLQLNLALEPSWRFKYKQKLIDSLPKVSTSTVDWLNKP